MDPNLLLPSSFEEIRREEPPLPAGGMLIPFGLFVLSFFFWDSMVLWPIKILTVLFHELSHGLAAILTGGSIHHIEINANEGGLCVTQGGSRFIIYSAGYLGSLLWGSGLFLIATKTRYDREVVTVLGGLLILVTALYIRSFTGILFGLGFGAAMIAFANYYGEIACDQLLRYLGLTSSFYVLLDIKSDLIDRSIAESDASRLGEMFHLPGFVIGLIWLVMALAITYKVLHLSLKK